MGSVGKGNTLIKQPLSTETTSNLSNDRDRDKMDRNLGRGVIVPKSFTKMPDRYNNYDMIEEGAQVYIDPNYVRTGESAKKYFVMEMRPGYALLADNKRQLNNSEGRIYGWNIRFYKNP